MKKFLPRIKVICCGLLCFSFIIAFACFPEKKTVGESKESTLLNIWQIDSFEGGKGSRSDYLQKIGNSFAERENCYVDVTAISAESARVNLSKGIVPDLISFGIGSCGFESFISEYKVWCSGSYCLLTLDKNADFGDANKDNTIINEGKDNFISAVALLCGLQGSQTEKPTGAYVKLIGGKYKYLLGTQRDVFRLKTREVEFSVKAITVFNDLYQNIAITSASKNITYAQRYIDNLLSKKNEICKIGMLFEGERLYDNEMSELESVAYEYRLMTPLSREAREEIDKSILANDINKLKKLLN